MTKIILMHSCKMAAIPRNCNSNLPRFCILVVVHNNITCPSKYKQNLRDQFLGDKLDALFGHELVLLFKANSSRLYRNTKKSNKI